MQQLIDRSPFSDLPLSRSPARIPPLDHADNVLVYPVRCLCFLIGDLLFADQPVIITVDHYPALSTDHLGSPKQ